MLKMSSRCVGAAFFGIVSALVSGLCFGIRAWWLAGIFLVAAFACLCWCSRGAIFIDQILTRFGVPLEGIYDTERGIDQVERARKHMATARTGPPQSRPKPKLRRRSDFAEGTRKKGCVSERPEGRRPSKPKGQGRERLN